MDIKVDWQVTATTIYCDSVDDEVTLIVNKDGSARCTGLKKYTEPSPQTIRMVKQKKKADKRNLSCRGSSCTAAGEYRDRIFSQESKKAGLTK
jgi:hypothetical protein